MEHETCRRLANHGQGIFVLINNRFVVNRHSASFAFFIFLRQLHLHLFPGFFHLVHFPHLLWQASAPGNLAQGVVELLVEHEVLDQFKAKDGTFLQARLPSDVTVARVGSVSRVITCRLFEKVPVRVQDASSRQEVAVNVVQNSLFALKQRDESTMTSVSCQSTPRDL